MTITKMPLRMCIVAHSSGDSLGARLIEPLSGYAFSSNPPQLPSRAQEKRSENRNTSFRPKQGLQKGNTPLRSLAGGSLASRYHGWRGTSGRRYVCSVFPIDQTEPDLGLPDYTDVIILAVARGEDGGRCCVSLLLKGTTTDLVTQQHFIRAALAAGAVVWHIHLLAADAQQRRAVARDITAVHEPHVSNIG
jgi:hypothetical protein